MSYEDTNVDFYSESKESERLFSHPDLADLKANLELTYSGFRNPFRDSYLWLKGELLDLAGLNDALLGRDSVIKAQGNLEQKRIIDMQDLDGRKAGKKSLKTLFKGAEAKEKDITKLENSIKATEVEIEDFKKLVSFLTLYMNDFAIKNFKKTKSSTYMQMLNGFSVKEISNSHASATMWHTILENSGKHTTA